MTRGVTSAGRRTTLARIDASLEATLKALHRLLEGL